MGTFSERNNYQPVGIPITTREAPHELRSFVVRLALKAGYDEDCPIPASALIRIMCDILYVAPEGNWGESWLIKEAEKLIQGCRWHEVYDIAESFYDHLHTYYAYANLHERYAKYLNKFFNRKGIGYKMERGEILVRFDDVDEKVVQDSISMLEQKELETSASELRESYKAISRKPIPNTTGAIQHARASVECVAREISGDKKSTFGKIINDHPSLFPGAIKKIAEGIQGYTSDMGAHLKEGRPPSFKEAELMVGLSASLSSYLIKND